MVDFVNIVMEMRGGKVAADISSKFDELIRAVLDTGGGGKLMLALEVKASRADIHEGVKEVTITHTVAIKRPERRIGESVFHVTPQQGLSRTDPEQLAMFEQQEVKQ